MPKVVDHDAYRRELLDKSFDLFADRGYASLTMRELAQGIGVSTGTLYHYFATKEEVFDALMTHVTDAEIEIAVSALPNRQRPVDGLVALFRYVDQSSSRLVKTQLLAIDYLKHRPEGGASLVKRSNAKINKTVAKLTGIKDPLALAHVGAALQGLLFTKEIDGVPVDFEAHARLVARILDRK